MFTGAAPKPYVTSLDQTKHWALLQCKVRGAFPKPKLHWQDSDGKVLPAEEPQISERGGRYDVSLQTTVTSTTTNRFNCVAKQEDIRHVIAAEIYVPLSGEIPPTCVLICKSLHFSSILGSCTNLFSVDVEQCAVHHT